MNKILILFLIFSKFGFAEEIYFSCERQQSCFNNECDSIKQFFDIQVNTKTGEMSNFPVFIAPGCMDSDSLKISYSVNDISITTTCEDTLKSSSLKLSRRSLKLSVTTIYQREGLNMSQNSSICKKSNKRQF